MGSVVSDISNSVNRNLTDLGNNIKKSPLAPAMMTNAITAPWVIGANALTPEDKPQAPGVDASLQQLKDYQMQQARDFRESLPQRKQYAAEGLKADANEMLNQQQEQMDTGLNQRGLLYGGLAQGKKQGLRAESQKNLGKALQKSYTAFDSAADEMDRQAIDTAYGIQRQAQQIQDNIYAQAQAELNGRNSMIGNMASTAALAAIAL